jgi:hypothetical protein
MLLQMRSSSSHSSKRSSSHSSKRSSSGLGWVLQLLLPFRPRLVVQSPPPSRRQLLRRLLWPQECLLLYIWAARQGRLQPSRSVQCNISN